MPPDLSLPDRVSTEKRQRPRKPGVKRISLALQGGGSYGAFTWGVMHRLMSDPHLYIDGISGTSAGALNAAVFADGFIKGRRQGAIDALETFWDRVSKCCTIPRMSFPGWPDVWPGGWDVDAEPSFMMLDFMARILAPSQFNPLDINPVRDVLLELVDFEGLRRRPDVKLFVTASNVRTCKSRLFRTPEITVDTLMASACLPLLYKAVEIEGEHYWDGGYLGNPSIYPLINECNSSDVVLVQINPMTRPDVPVSAGEILNRINEMTFNAGLVSEMFGIAAISTLIDSGKLDDDRYTTVRFHKIGADADLSQYGALSKLNTERRFLQHLHDLGYEAAERWIAENFDRIGWESTIDVLETFA